MPIYEYECNSCGHRLEAIQKFSDPPLEDCPECGQAAALRKLISAAAFHLKGSGWYATDFKDKPKAKSDGKDKAGEKAPEAKSETKSDSKAETKSESKPKSGDTSSSSAATSA